MVEDDPATRKALLAILRRQGWDVLSASTLSEARSLLEVGPAVLILDLMLPDGDGTTLLRQIRVEERPIHVIVTTGTSDSARLDMVRRLEPVAILTKPVDLPQLLRAIQTLG